MQGRFIAIEKGKNGLLLKLEGCKLIGLSYDIADRLRPFIHPKLKLSAKDKLKVEFVERVKGGKYGKVDNYKVWLNGKELPRTTGLGVSASKDDIAGLFKD